MIAEKTQAQLEAAVNFSRFATLVALHTREMVLASDQETKDAMEEAARLEIEQKEAMRHLANMNHALEVEWARSPLDLESLKLVQAAREAALKATFKIRSNADRVRASQLPSIHTRAMDRAQAELEAAR